ncbi:proton-dependent oligopeptide transporter, POT family [Scheffersomyces stipitis CBS 6054]|uniref:Proton-dependent oligopeptide transporter, POT family n=1 Tax=Scheffersomyces stipitis (strain ATCC 58785 / CBS 6054 / NBRC 10063 / NRRL Y-11545) TaxID=322104 RepID=A3LV79_PICST|nr:proton-dependent oligopeptide transporter, POT family [Scheffersomyces stipitis CBS 6054]ABN66728.1 proton-dependent oligopeptide transporter, POT family [Scheffersomyces stipitis CBS 6054]
MSDIKKASSSESLQAVDEKIGHIAINDIDKEISSGDDYDFNDANNYSTHYVDEFNPKGLRIPTDEESETLRRILGRASYASYLICLCELAERASYYSVTGILSNFIQRPMPKDSPHGWGAPADRNSSVSAGALGQGLQAANALTLLLTFLAYCVPLYGGFVADTRIGKFKAIWVGVIAGFVSHVLFVIAAIPSVLKHGDAAMAPTVLAIITLAFGTGFIKPNLLPLLMDQYREKTDVVKVLPSGEKVIVDRQKTLERMTLIFYWAINIGAFFQLATSYCERDVGFWLAFFVPIIMYLVLPVVLVFLQSRLVRDSPKGSVLETAWKVTRVTFSKGWISRWRNNTLWEYAKPSNMLERGREFYNEKKKTPITWDDQWVLDIKQTVNSCKIFIYFPIFNLADGGIGSVQTSQAGAMTTNGVPNDLFNNFNPLTIIILIPILDYIVYPILRKYRIEFRPVWRIWLGFILAGSSQIAGAIIQWKVYKTSPCGYYATTCDEFSPLSAWQDVSLYILSAAGECFAMTTAYELAYTRSPPHMKGLVMALFLFTSAISAAISQAITPALIDPHLIWPFAGIAIATFIAAFMFVYQFRNLHKEMEEERIIREALDHSERDRDLISHGGIDNDNNLQAVTSIKSAVGK